MIQLDSSWQDAIDVMVRKYRMPARVTTIFVSLSDAYMHVDGARGNRSKFGGG
jgi:hypothetical protein